MNVERVHDVRKVTDGTLYDIPTSDDPQYRSYQTLMRTFTLLLAAVVGNQYDLSALAFTLEDIGAKELQKLGTKEIDFRSMNLRLKTESVQGGGEQWVIYTTIYYGDHRNDNVKWVFTIAR
jgi:hypothetical protein